MVLVPKNPCASPVEKYRLGLPWELDKKVLE